MYITAKVEKGELKGLSDTNKFIKALCAEGAFDRIEEVRDEVNKDMAYV